MITKKKMQKFQLNAFQPFVHGKWMGEDKNIIIVDDSIVRGNTIKGIVKLFSKAKSVHIRVSSPPVTGTCNYGIDIPTKEELIKNGNSIEDILDKCTRKIYDVSLSTKECPISLEPFKEGEEIIELPCNHIFNENSIKGWLKEKHNCPVCRTEIISTQELLDQQRYNITHNIDALIDFMAARMREGSDEQIEEFFEIY